MTQYVFANNVNTTLASALPSASTTIVLASSANLPTLSAGQIMSITLNDAATGLQYEICYVTSISGTSLTVTRAQEGTSALNWNVGDYAFCAFTAGTTAVSTGNPSNTFQVANATVSNQAVAMGQLYGGLKGIARLTSSGSITVPVGVTTMYVSGAAPGGGGGSGGSASGSNGVGAGGGGGGAGQSLVRQPYTVTPGGSISVTIGAAGSGGTGVATGGGNIGGTGGNIVISGAGFNGGTSVTLSGGSGGGGGANGTNAAFGGASAAGGDGGAGYPKGSDGTDVAGTGSAAAGGAGGNGGMGASSPFGGGGGAGRGAQGGARVGYPAGGFGAGGGGGGGPFSPTNGTGGAGGNASPGLVIFEW